MKIHRVLALFFGMLLVALTSLPLIAQSSTSGAISGAVLDSSGSAVPAAAVTVTNSATGRAQTFTTNAQGGYTASFLTPGTYSVKVTAKGFQPVVERLIVAVGQTMNGNVRLKVASSEQTVTVSSEVPVLQTQDGNIATTISSQTINNVPNPGNDITSLAQVAPGAVMNTQAGYGNFEMYGLPASSNLFVLDGQDANDPFLNLNNSGATNLTLGANELDQATVVTNGYTGENGRLAGSTVQYTTKSGANQFHGNAVYNWDGRVMNANSFMNNASGSPRPFVNANQYAWSFGGPIVKNKTFFFVDQEGLNVVLPTSANVNIPSPQFQAATLSHLNSVNPAAVPFYQHIFDLYNGAAGVKSATPLAGSCGKFSPIGYTANAKGKLTVPKPWLDASGNPVPCADQFRSTAGNYTHEWLYTTRIDQVLGNSDELFFRFQTDHGNQATRTDPINPAFNANSIQPEYQGQLHETHSFASGASNEIVLSSQWYSAIFGPHDLPAALKLFPTTLRFTGGAFNGVGGTDYAWPQGRNVTQYQLTDNYAWSHGAHNLKVGFDLRRDLVNNQDFGFYSSGYAKTNLDAFYNDSLTADDAASGFYIQSFPSKLAQMMQTWNLGIYLQDGWTVSPNLKLTLSLRGDHNSNPACQNNCFAGLTNAFDRIDHTSSIPYNQTITNGLRHALPGYQEWSVQPRLGFAWTPFGPATVVRGGFGFFSDAFPASVTDNLAQNAPLDNQFTIVAGGLTPADGSKSVYSAAAASNGALLSSFSNGGTWASIYGSDPTKGPSFFFSDPKIDTPTYEEWNLQIQHSFGAGTAVSANYVGNHGYHLAIVNNGLNAYGAPGLPAGPVDPRFTTISQIQSAGVSNYNGLTLSVTHHFASSFLVNANYTWGHGLDDVSNGGFNAFNLDTNTSLLNPQDPHNLKRYNYGNADYDVRHSLNLNYVWNVPFQHYLHFLPSVTRGWTVSGTLFARGGLPFTVIDSNATGLLTGQNYGGTIFANWTGASVSCTRTAVDKSCLSSQFTPATTADGSAVLGFGNQQRNQFRGPGFFDTDLSLMKSTSIPRWESAHITVGAQFFNLLNHPNFDQPVADIASPQFGSILSTVSVPTSIMGAFLGGDASARLVELTAKLTF